MGDPERHETDALPQREPHSARQAERLRRLEADLRVRPQTSRELAALYGLPLRTVQRDLQTLRKLGRGVETHAGHSFIPAPRPALGAAEVLTAHAALRLLYHLAPAHHPHAVAILHKLAGQLPEANRRLLDASVSAAPEPRGDDRTAETVAQAWNERRVLRFDYRQPGGEVERGNELCVYLLDIHRSNLAPSVTGLERRHDHALRTFRLSRMESAALLPDRYDIPETFNPREHLTDTWGMAGATHPVKVRLRFTPDAAYAVLEGGYPQASEPLIYPDGSVELDLQAGADAGGVPHELLPWLLSWGARVEVLEPEPLRRHWLNELRLALLRYDPEASRRGTDRPEQGSHAEKLLSLRRAT